MRRKTRTKVKKSLMISGIAIGIIILILGIWLIVKLNQKPQISYDDGIVGKNYFVQITVDFSSKEVKRDEIDTSLEEEFGISKEQENIALNSEEEFKKLFSNSVFEISTNNQIYTIKNPYQTKSIIVQADEIKEKVQNEDVIQITDNLYVLSFYSEKLTKAMYEYYKEKEYINKIFLDDVNINEPINDISQTMYGKAEVDLNGHHSLGVTKMNMNNYMKIINDNGNPKDIVIATIGYGINQKHEFFNGRIAENGYNYVLNNKDTSETISQGSRIAEVLVDSTTTNVKIMPLVTVTEEGYVTTSSILRALQNAIQNADVICYELLNEENEAISLALEGCFKENVPVCSVSSSSNEDYPAKHSMTIAVSSLDRENNIADYSGKGKYIDFSAPSTDVEEIFSRGANISRWSGAEYSNAQIAAAIALIKTYDKEATILDVYNFLRNFCEDLGLEGKDELYGYGCPNFANIKISDIDKTNPEIQAVLYENNTWEILKQVRITASDNIRINAYAITKNENGPEDKEWNVLKDVTGALDTTETIKENGKYYVWIKDMAGNTVSKEFSIDKIDITPPKIAYSVDESTLVNGYVTINVTAEDLESGLFENPYSWDKRIWSNENASKVVKQNGRYKVYAEDNLGNIGELEIVINCFPQEGRYELADGDIITKMNVSAKWMGNTNEEVEITLNKDISIAGWQITTTPDVPSEFIAVDGNIINSNSMQADENGLNSSNQNTNENTALNENSDIIPENTVLNSTLDNDVSNNTNTSQEQQNQVTNENVSYTRTEPIVLKASLDINTSYYFWIKEANQTTRYQIFRIYKAQI